MITLYCGDRDNAELRAHLYTKNVFPRWDMIDDLFTHRSETVGISSKNQEIIFEMARDNVRLAEKMFGVLGGPSEYDSRYAMEPDNAQFFIVLNFVITHVVSRSSGVVILYPELGLTGLSASILATTLADIAERFADTQIYLYSNNFDVLNGIRIAAEKYLVSADHVVLSYWQNSYTVIEPKLYQSGGIDPWPTGFFDQIDNDLLELF